MVAEQSTLTPGDLAFLADLCDPGKPVAFATRPDLAAFLDRPEVQAQLAAIIAVRDIRYSASLQAANLNAIATLQDVIKETSDLTEKRRAATSILRTGRPAARPLHRDRRDPRVSTHTFRAPAGLLNSTPGAPPPHIPAHFKRINTFVYSETPSRTLSAKQAVANALALIQQGDSESLQSLFNHCTHRGPLAPALPANVAGVDRWPRRQSRRA
jgi:hypothetical protein